MRILLFSVAHSGARTWCHALPWWAVCCRYPHGPQQPANKNTLDYDVSSRRWSRTTAKAMPCAGWGLSKLGQFDMSVYKFVL